MLQGTFGKQHEKLVAPQSNSQVGSPDHTVQTRGKFEQYVITGRMAVGVVDVLEIVQVQREDGQGMPLALRPSDFRGQALLSKTAVVKTRQWINHGQIAGEGRKALFFGRVVGRAVG